MSDPEKEAKPDSDKMEQRAQRLEAQFEALCKKCEDRQARMEQRAQSLEAQFEALCKKWDNGSF